MTAAFVQKDISVVGRPARISGQAPFSISDLIAEAAEQAMRVPIRYASNVDIDVPVMSGIVIANEIAPGLVLNAQDLAYHDDGTFEAWIDRSLLFAMLLGGHAEPLTLGGEHIVTYPRRRLTITGIGQTVSAVRSHRAGVRTHTFGLTIGEPFFDRFNGGMDAEGIEPLRALLEPGVHPVLLAPVRELACLAASVFADQYTGSLSTLFRESVALRFLVVATASLGDEARQRRLLGSRLHDQVVAACDILEASLIDPPSVLSLASQVGTNAKTLQSGFRACFNTTIFGYLRRQRLEIARLLIAEGNVSIAEAGYRVGFSRPAAYAAAYRRAFGHAPSADRSARSH